LQDIMRRQIDAPADVIWGAVATVETAKGVEERQPSTDAEWQSLRDSVVTLAEAANLLRIDGRHIVTPGASVPDAEVPGVLDAAGIEAAIAARRDAFSAFAAALQATAADILDATDKRDVARIHAAGEALDQACEACHRVFWYPGDPRPKDPPADAVSAPR
jgi:hypothetical protein